jgi:hypothetical protein
MVVVEQLAEGAPSMGKLIADLSSVATVGLDLAKHVIPSSQRRAPTDISYR